MKQFSWLALLFLSAIARSAYGSENNHKVAFKDGFYGALAFGVNWGNAQWSGLNSISLVDDIHNTNAVFKSWTPHGKRHTSAKGIGSASLGYQLVDARLYLGLQIGYTLRDQQHFGLNDRRAFNQLATLGLPPLSTISGTSLIKTKASLSRNEINIDLKPGILILKNLVFYARAGVAFTRLKITNSGAWTEVAGENGIELETAASSYKNKGTVGFRVGGGTEYLITKYLGISLDYIYSNYGKIKTFAENQNAGFFNFNQVYGVSAPEVKIFTQTLTLGIVAHF